MVLSNLYQTGFDFPQIAFQRLILGILVLTLFSFAVFSQTQLSQPDEKTLIVENAPEMEVFAFGKTVIVKTNAKGVLAFGGDVIIEGKVTGDVATIGGSVIQKESAFIGGDVIIFGGKYQPEANKPLRSEGKETVMYAGYEDELRDLMQNPTQILAPSFSLSFLAQRILSVLFWFIISLALTTITPGAISRAVTRFQLSRLKMFGVGGLVFVVTTLTVLFSLEFLPSFVSVVIGLMAFVLIMLAYVFGRVVLQASVGKWVAKQFRPQAKQSETSTLLIGTIIWTTLLSIPYLWTIALFILFTASLGIVTTARTNKDWQGV
ncbi:MAG: hypothetical protein HKN25_15205 [Pyrinomonadaceae bacterium]|nr:hypothetical protein [Pyrinomonadaceae bacterium]